MRNKSGSLLLLMLGVLALLLIAVSVYSGFSSVLFVQQKLQEQTENMAMEAVQNFNSGDRGGRMNNVVAACRELVFNSRKVYSIAAGSKQYMVFAPLAQLYLEESRDSALFMGKERDKLVTLSLTEAHKSLKNHVNNYNKNEMLLPWIKVEPVFISDLQAGYVSGTESNVSAPLGNADLLEYDSQQKYLDSKTNLYLGNISARLPEDSDLTFKISCLAPPVQGTASPSRLGSPQEFRPLVTMVKNGEPAVYKSDYLPSAVQVKLATELALKGMISRAEAPVNVSVTGIGNGASPIPLPTLKAETVSPGRR
jgi:hypothetical protein